MNPRCSRCHRPLTDPFSVALGMGPECRGALSKKGWTFPKPNYRISRGRVEYLGMTGRIQEPLVGDVTKKRRNHDRNQPKS